MTGPTLIQPALVSVLPPSAPLARSHDLRSTLMHLLPGLAMFAHQHFGPGTETWAARLQRPAPAPALSWLKRSDLPALLGWRVAAPLLFYAAWQLHYWLVVQVGFARHIQARGHDTSFRCLSRRAKRAGNLLAAMVLHGSVARRVVVYGARAGGRGWCGVGEDGTPARQTPAPCLPPTCRACPLLFHA